MSEGDRELIGVRGWLLFFVIVLAVFSPVIALFGIATLYSDPAVAVAYGDRWAALQAGEWALILASIAGMWFLAWRLVYIRNVATVRIVIAGIWIVGVGGLLVELLIVSAVGGLPLDLVVGGMGPELARPFVFSTIWTAYLLRSRRVANTYRVDADEVGEVFG